MRGCESKDIIRRKGYLYLADQKEFELHVSEESILYIREFF